MEGWVGLLLRVGGVGGADGGELIQGGGDDGKEASLLFDTAGDISRAAVEDVGGSGHGFTEVLGTDIDLEMDIGLSDEEFAERGVIEEAAQCFCIIALEGKAVVEIRDAGLYGGQAE